MNRRSAMSSGYSFQISRNSKYGICSRCKNELEVYTVTLSQGTKSQDLNLCKACALKAKKYIDSKNDDNSRKLANAKGKDYYNDLGLSPSDSIEEIQTELDRLEKLWSNRLVSSPEKASSMLALISEAYDVFGSESSKQEYDGILFAVENSDITSRDDRLPSFNKWYQQAVGFYNNNQFDLAKTAIERAAQYYEPSSENAEYFSYAADIYRNNKSYQECHCLSELFTKSI